MDLSSIQSAGQKITEKGAGDSLYNENSDGEAVAVLAVLERNDREVPVLSVS